MALDGHEQVTVEDVAKALEGVRRRDQHLR
jgi:hypothetical protein